MPMSQHLHSKGSVIAKSRTWLTCASRRHLFVVNCNWAVLEALFSIWSTPYCSAKNAQLATLLSTSSVINSNFFAFCRKNEAKLTCDLVPRYSFSTIVFRGMSKNLINCLCLRPHRFISLEIQRYRKKREKTINHTGTRIGTTACQLEEKLNITGCSAELSPLCTTSPDMERISSSQAPYQDLCALISQLESWHCAPPSSC